MTPACNKADRSATLSARSSDAAPPRMCSCRRGRLLGGTLVRRLVQEGVKVRAGVRRLPKSLLPVRLSSRRSGDPEYVDVLVAGVARVFHVERQIRAARRFQRGTAIGTRKRD